MKILLTGGCGFTPHHSLLQNGLRPVIAVCQVAGRAEKKMLIAQIGRVL